MKKLILVALAVAMLLPCIALAAPQTIDLEAMSFDDLKKLSNDVFKAMMASADFKEVPVPAGSYVIGDQIPAGEYNISTKSVMATITVTNKESSFPDLKIISEGEDIGRMVLEDGMSIEFSAGVIFKPFAGLGF